MHRFRLTLVAALGAVLSPLILLAPVVVPATSAAAATTLLFAGHGSIGEAYVVGATPGEHLVLVAPNGHVVGGGGVDALGSLIVRNVAPGEGYRFKVVNSGPQYGHTTATFKVLSVHDTPPESFYASQHLHAGLNYITMRDGVQLAATLRLPPGKTLADGPFPTVIEYSGYATAAPHDLTSALLSGSTASDPLLPDTSTVVGSVLTPLLGFATVSLQMRGTGCSGGAFDLFGYPSDYDGYDAVQITAAQPWVKGHKVGMVGISYSGFSQLEVAGTRPPGLAAITPLSPTDDLYSTGYPGGIYNDGFAKSWMAQATAAARPAPQGGQPWARAEIAAGDKQCLANQALHLQTVNIKKIMSPAVVARTPAIFDQRSPTVWAHHIDVPVFLVGSLEDEQTGPQWPALISALKRDPNVYVTMQNGTHDDSLGPATITRWLEFLDIYVAHQVPTPIPASLAAASGPLYKQLTGSQAEPLPAVRFTTASSVSDAQAQFAASDPRVRVLFDNGGGSLGPGALQPTGEADFSTWPPPLAVPTTFTLGPQGTLSSRETGGAKPSSASTVSFRPDPSARPATTLTASANAASTLPPYDWTPVTGSSGLGFVTPPLSSDLTVIGPASLNLRLKSSAADTDLQATVSEVLPNGQEMYVTSGFLRAGFRALDQSASTALDPVHQYVRLEPMPRGQSVSVRIPIDPIDHDFRAGSRLRITISAPGGDRPEWAFDTPDTHGQVVDTIALGGATGSTLVLPVLPGVVPGDAAPACPSLRGEPCRPFVRAGNGG